MDYKPGFFMLLNAFKSDQALNQMGLYFITQAYKRDRTWPLPLYILCQIGINWTYLMIGYAELSRAIFAGDNRHYNNFLGGSSMGGQMSYIRLHGVEGGQQENPLSDVVGGGGGRIGLDASRVPVYCCTGKERYTVAVWVNLRHLTLSQAVYRSSLFWKTSD